MIGAVDSRPSPKETFMPFHVPLWLLGQCTPRVRDTVENDVERRERLKPSAGLARYCSPAYFTQPGNLPEHLTHEAGNSAWLLLLLRPFALYSCQDPKDECGDGDHWIPSSLGCDTFNECPSPLFAIVCLSALLSLSAEPSCLGRLIPRLSHKTVLVTAGHWDTDQSLASSTGTSCLKC